MIREATIKVIEGASLTRDEAAAVMTEIMEAACTPAQFGAFVTALRAKGETADEIAGCLAIMRDKAVPVAVSQQVRIHAAPAVTAWVPSISPPLPLLFWRRPDSPWQSTATAP